MYGLCGPTISLSNSVLQVFIILTCHALSLMVMQMQCWQAEPEKSKPPLGFGVAVVRNINSNDNPTVVHGAKSVMVLY